MFSKRFLVPIVALAIMVLTMGASSCSSGDSNNYQAQQTKLTNTYGERFQNSVPYPLSQMHDSLERHNLVKRLLTFNDASRVGYVYLMNYGKIIGYYVLKGKISSTQSQLSVTEQIQERCTHNHCYGATVPSMADDGSFGTNEGGDKGIFFFTTDGKLVETDLDWVYSDQPLPIDVPLFGGTR